MSPYLMFGAIAVAAAIVTRRARPSGASGRSIADGTSTDEGQQNRNHGSARRMKATRNFHPPFYGHPRRWSPRGITIDPPFHQF